jgi:hypothetical protein
MRTCAIACAVVGLTLLVAAGAPGRQPGKDSDRDRIARLIKQLGDEKFVKREAASRELESIGVPAMGALGIYEVDGDAPK